MIRKYRWLLLPAIISILPTLPFVFGYFPAVGDMRDVFIPLEIFFHTQELQGHIPAWNPAVSFGFPVIASAQIGFFYPLLFIARLLPISFELPIIFAIHLVALAVGTALFARRLGMSKEASALVALSFALSQFVWQHETHLNIFLAIAWFPWQMLAADMLFRTPRLSIKKTIILVPLFAIPFLIGQLQIPFFIMLVSMVYALFLNHSKKSMVHLLFIAVLTGGLTAIQLVPTGELAMLSSRGEHGGFNVYQANQFSYPFYHLPTILFPRFYGNDFTYWGKRLEIEYGFYIGVIPLVLAVWYIVYSRKKHAEYVFFGSLALISFLLALGSLSPFRLIGIEPSLWIFSAPSRWLLFTTFILSMFAGFGFDALDQHKNLFKKFSTRIAALVIGCVLVGNIVLHLIPLSFPSEKLSSMLISARSSSVSLTSPYTYIVLITLIIVPWILSKKNYRQILLVITLCDLVIIASTTTPNISWKDTLAVPSTIAQLPQTVRDHTARIYTIWKNGDTGAYFTDPSSRATLRDRTARQDLLVPMISSEYGIYGVEWPASLDIVRETNQTSQLRQDKNINTSLAADLNIGAVLQANETNAISIKQLEPKSRVELDSGTARITSETATNLTITTSSKIASTLIVRDAYYPNWHAYVDGNEVPIMQSPLFFRSIHVPAGDHIVLIKYRALPIEIGGAFSLVTLIIVLSIIVFRARINE